MGGNLHHDEGVVWNPMGFAAAGARCHQRVGRFMQAGKPPPSLLLMAERGVLGLEIGKKPPSAVPRHKGQADLHIRPLHPRGLVLDEAAHQAMHEGVSGFKSGHEKLFKAGLDVFGKEGWEHGVLFC
jgi:hypothetical protein